MSDTMTGSCDIDDVLALEEAADHEFALESFLLSVIKGEYDDQLEKINETLFSRRQIVRQIRSLTNVATLRPKDRVKVNKGIRPAYFIGAVGTVIRVLNDRVYVSIDREYRKGKYVDSISIGFPPSTLDKI